MGVAEDFAPSFTQKPQLRQEDDGNRLVFECQLLSSPKPDITWFRGETQLSEDGRTVFKTNPLDTNKYLVVLELDDVVETDAGLYKVKAKNKMGEVAASINLNFSREYLTNKNTIPYFLTIPYSTSIHPIFKGRWKKTASPAHFVARFRRLSKVLGLQYKISRNRITIF